MVSDLLVCAIEDLKAGKFVLICDDIDRENEADLVMAASKVEATHVNFMINHAKGLICVPMTPERAKELKLDLMVTQNNGTLNTAFTVTVDAAKGIGSGISSKDRAHTIKCLALDECTAQDFERPGHIFPLIAHAGGLKARRGHTEASVELLKMADLTPVAVICETLDEEGNPLKGKTLLEFAQSHNIKIISIAQILESQKLSK